MQNLSIGVNVVYEGSPSRILKVLLISFGMTILPKSSTLRTIPVAFIYLLSSLFTNYDASICKPERIIPGMIFKILKLALTLTFRKKPDA